MTAFKPTRSTKSSRLILLALPLLSLAAGCGINSDFTAEQQQRDADVKMAWLDKAIQIAERHDLAYRIEMNSTGRPSIGETIDLYLDTGLSAKVTMFGNAGAQPPASPRQVD
jgi:hypothetical protein